MKTTYQYKFYPDTNQKLELNQCGELLDLKRVDSTVLQDVSKCVDKAFERFIVGDSKGGKSGKPRFKSESSFKTMTFANAKMKLFSPIAIFENIGTKHNL